MYSICNDTDLLRVVSVSTFFKLYPKPVGYDTCANHSSEHHLLHVAAAEHTTVFHSQAFCRATRPKCSELVTSHLDE